MQVYLEDNLKDFKTRFIQLLCGYLELEERNLGKIIYINAKIKETLKFPGIPFYIPTYTEEESISNDELKIAKAICKETQ